MNILGGKRFSRNALTLLVLAVFALLPFFSFAAARTQEAHNSTPGDLPKGLPRALWRRLIPSDNPITEDKVILGRALYFDKRLSADGAVSCATCHDPATAFADRNSLAVGVSGKAGTRNAPTILNAAFAPRHFWDGRASSLEEQAKQPLVNPLEMGMKDHAAVVARVSSIPEYRRRFRQVFGAEGVNIDTIVKAIATFERTQLSGNSPFDRFMAGDEDAISDSQKRGWGLFQNKAGCIECHAFSAALPFFTDYDFHNTGVATEGKDLAGIARRAQTIRGAGPDTARTLTLLSHTDGLSDLGRFLITKLPGDIGAFKTPTLRDVELTGPYMHDGSEKTLLDVIRFYNRGGERNATLDHRIRPLDLSEEQMGDLVEFLRALTSDDVLRQAQKTRPQTHSPTPLPLSHTPDPK